MTMEEIQKLRKLVDAKVQDGEWQLRWCLEGPKLVADLLDEISEATAFRERHQLKD